MTGSPFEFETADSMGYHYEAIWINNLISAGSFDIYLNYIAGRLSDAGYPIYLSIIYSLFGSYVIIPRIIKAILSAITCVLIYKIAARNFGDATGKIAGIAAMLAPNLIYYCGLHLKETEMVFLVVLFLDNADYLLFQKGLSYKKLTLSTLCALGLFFFRTVLGLTAFFSLFTLLIFSRYRHAKFGKNFLIALWFLLAFGLLLNQNLQKEIIQYWEGKAANISQSMGYRSVVEGGNTLAKYGKTSFFLPVIITAPFPTLVNIDNQKNHMFFNGGYYVKNICSFFVYIAFIYLFQKKRYRQHLLLISFFITYIVILALSKFALSERFHLPGIPLFLIFFALGISKMNKKYLRLYTPYLLFLALAIVGWNWFKLAGRGF